MKRACLLVGCLAASLFSASWLAGQQSRPPGPLAKKAKKVWTNDDFPERPAPKPQPAAEKAETAAKPAEAEAAGKADAAKAAGQLQDLDRTEASLEARLADLNTQRLALISDRWVIEERRNASRDPAPRASFEAQLKETQQKIDEVNARIDEANSRLAEIRRRKTPLQPPAEATTPETPAPKLEEKKR